MSDNFNRTAYALQPVAPDENPFDWDWAALHEEVGESITALGVYPDDWFHDITLESLEEEPAIPGWWDVLDAPEENGPCIDTSHGPDTGTGAELQPDRDLQSFPKYHSLATPPMAEGGFVAPQEPNNTASLFSCDHSNCGKSFKWKGDLTRHQKSHKDKREFPCTALDYNARFRSAASARVAQNCSLSNNTCLITTISRDASGSL
ncbi:hypothetical protein EJ07DRAFT_155142 [Lizonia empirigonia]|nr:hypothetical protein EJ07DRAFT_155142 [Lizonia empirigonia]